LAVYLQKGERRGRKKEKPKRGKEKKREEG